MDFSKMFQREIPLQEAAEYFVNMTKKAEWTDPVDMTGQLEGMFLVPVEQVLAKLRGVITAKFRKMVAYHTYAESLNHPSWRGVKLEFHDHAEDEKNGADYYMKRATVLGGPVLFDAIEPPPPTTNLDTIMMTMARAEQEGIAAQRELRQMVGDENPMKIGIEEQMLCDQHHLDELFQMMSPECRLALEQGGAAAPPAALEMEAPEATPPEQEAGPETQPSPEKTADIGRSLHRAGVAVQKGARRAGELVTGSRARDLAHKANLEHSKMKGSAKGFANALERGIPAEDVKRTAERMLPKMQRTVRHGQKYNDMAIEELGRSEKVQRGLAHGAVIGGTAMIGGALLSDRESEKEKKAAENFEKAAFGAIAGLVAGYGQGKNVAGQTAAALAPEGRVLRSEEIARQAATVGGPLGGLAALKYGLQPAMDAGRSLGRSVGLPPIAAEIMVPMAVATLGSMMGGAATGAATAGVQQLRGPVGKKKAPKESAEPTASEDQKTAGAKVERMHPGTEGHHGPVLKAALENGVRGTVFVPEKVASVLRFDLAVMKLASDLGTADPSMVAPSSGQMEPTNYLQAELAGRQAQEQNESSFYRQQLQQTSQQSQMLQQQVADMQAQLQSSAQQPDQTQQIMQQAVMAQDEATRQAMEAAKARIGAQQLRALVLEAVSQDPLQLGEQAFPQQQMVDPMTGQPAQMDPATGQPVAADPMAAQPGAPADPTAAQGASPPGPPAGAEPAQQTKMGSLRNAAIGAGAGALLGAGSSLLAGRSAPGLRGKVETLGGEQDGSFMAAANLAAAKAGLAHAELAEQHPARAALNGGLRGALTGAAVGGSLASAAGGVSNSVRELMR